MKQRHARLALIALALLVGLLALSRSYWWPVFLSYLDDENNARFQAFTAWVQWGLWLFDFVIWVMVLWFQPDGTGAGAPVKNEWHVKSGRDSQIATDKGQVGGTRVQDSAKVKGDAVGGDKYESHHYYANPPADKPPEIHHHHYGHTSGISALHQLPPPPADFTGREQELHELLQQMGTGGATISGVQGMGGMGKTALALVLAHRLREPYPDAQFFVPLAGASAQPLSPAQAMAQVIRACHPGANLPQEEARLTALYRSVLTGKRALLLLDDAANREQVETLLPPAGCALLITSRQQFTLPGLYALRLSTLPRADAEALLCRLAPRIAQHAKQLAHLCGHLPLALRVAGSLLNERPDLSPAEYIQRLKDARQRLKLVEASISLSYELLEDDSQQKWRMLALFAGDFDRSAAAAVWQIGEHEADDMLGVLLRYSLVQWIGQTEEPDHLDVTNSLTHSRYRLHDLARLFADSRLTERERFDCAHRHATHFERLLRQAKELYKQGGEHVLRGLALFDREWPNIEAGQAWASTHAAQHDAAAALCSDYPDAGAHILHLRQHPRDQIRWREAALSAARRLKRRSAEGTHLGNLGLAYYSQGEMRRAIEFYEQWLAITREIDDRRGEGQALGNLGVAYSDLGEVRRAIEFYEQQLAIAREIGDRYGEGTALWNMSLARDELGERDKAIACAQASLVIREQIEDPRTPKVRKKLAAWRGE